MPGISEVTAAAKLCCIECLCRARSSAGQENSGGSERGVVEAVGENPHWQYFLGGQIFQPQPPFTASLMTHFRKRFPPEEINRFSGKVFEVARLAMLQKKIRLMLLCHPVTARLIQRSKRRQIPEPF